MITLKQNNVLQISAEQEQVITLFATSTDVKASSRSLYTRTLRGFFNWVSSTGRSINALTVADLIRYKEELLAAGKSPLTVASYINSVKRFFEWAESAKLYPNIAKTLHAPKRQQAFLKQPLTPQQVAALLDYEKGTQGARDYAIVNLLVRTGLRTIELVRANVGDIVYKAGQRVLLVQGKGRDSKDNFVILTDAAYLPILAYLNSRRNLNDNAPLFASESNNNEGGRMTTRAISGLVKNSLKSIGLDHRVFTAHSLRHTAAVNILRAGGSLEQVQYTLRHTNPATTQIYTATMREEQRLQQGGEYMLDRMYNNIAIA